MSKLSVAINEINTVEYLASRKCFINQIHPLIKLVTTIFYIVVTVSFDRYDIYGVLAMFIYPFAIFLLADLSVKNAFYRLRIVLPLVCFIGILNPFFDTQLINVAGVEIRAGLLSMLTLMIKGVFTVLASYLLIATTSIDKICYAMKIVHLPSIFVTEIMLIYRYISLLLSEANKMTQAYSLRAPGQKGVTFKVWGSLAGQLLLRSLNRADNVYEAMCLRGYDGGANSYLTGDRIELKISHILYIIVWITVIITVRYVRIFEIIGGVFVR